MTRQPHKFAKADDCEKGKKMTSLIEKFKNVHFPNWMRGIKAANDNIPPVSRNIYHTYNNFLLYERRSFKQRRQNGKPCQKGRKLLDEIEKSVNQDFFGDEANEC